jgi:ABC-type molybdate transport system substrate-binding protein
MLHSIVSWWVAVLSRWCRAYPQTARRYRGSCVGVLVVGGILVWHGVGWAQQRALSPGGLHIRWHTAQVSAEVPHVQGQLTIFTAASLTEAFKEIGANIEQANPGTKVLFNFAGSPTLRTQLAQGARADVFASADDPNMQGAQREGTIASEPRLFVRNQLVAIVPAANPVSLPPIQPR